MNKMIRSLVVVSCVLLCCSAWAEGEEEPLVDGNGHILPGKTVDGVYRPDWANLTSFDIPWGKTYIAYDEDIASINANLTRMDWGANRTLILDGITSWPVGKDKPECLMWSMSGDLIVRANGSVSIKRYNYRVSGTLTIESGELVQENYYSWGGEKNAKIVIKDGATFRFNYGNTVFGNTRVYATGTGVGGKGALVLDSWSGDGCVPYLELQGDTRVVINKNGKALCSYKKVGTSGSLASLSPGTLKLNGHTLTIGGTTTSLTFDDMQVLPDGETDAEKGKIVFEPLTGGGSRTLIQTGLTALDLPIEANCGLKLTDGTWNGDFTMASGTALNLAPAKDATVTVSGSVSGSGDLTFGTSGATAAGTVRLLGANTYTGLTTVYGSSSFILALGQKGAIPDYSKFTVNGGKVGASVGYDDQGEKTWTAQEVLELGSTLGQSVLAVDASALEEPSELVFSAADVATAFPTTNPAWDSVGSIGGYTLTGPYTAERPLVISQTAGRIVLSGDDDITIGNSSVAGAGTVPPALVVSGTTVRQGDELVKIGSSAGNGTLIVTNAQWLSTSTTVPTSDQAGLDCNAIYLGYKSGVGVLEIQNGGVVSNKVMVGGGTYVNQGSGSGAIYVHPGAKLYAKIPGAAHLGSSIGQSNFGYLQQTGGEIDGSNLFVGGYGKGVFHMYGGEVNLQTFTPARCNSGEGVVYVTNGTINVSEYLQPSHGNDSTSQVTLDGPDAKLLTGTTYLYSNNNKNSRTQINLMDGGLLRIGNPCPYIDHSAFVAAGNPYHDILSFNGGVIQARAAEDFLAYSSERRYARVIVAEKGAVFDTNGKTCSLSRLVPVEGVVTGGVQAIDLGDPVEGLAGAPYVKITGGGYGATAVAAWDPETRVLKGVRITSHGWGYTQGAVTVTLKSCNWSKTISGAAVTVGDNDIGGFTKRGEGLLTIYSGTNSWAKWTRVEAGTVKATALGSIPDGTVLTVAEGATLDLNGTTPTFASVTPDSAGTVANGAVQLTGAWVVDPLVLPLVPAELKADVSISDSTIDLSTATLDPARKYVLLKVADGHAITGLPTVNLPQDWRIRNRGTSLVLSAASGISLIVR